MTVYTYAQLEQLWIQAGGPRGLAPLAAAIAEAESGGNSDAFNGHDTNGQGGTQVSAGLWQISNGTMTPVANWSNPAVNAQLAVGKWRAANGFSPWGTYTSGAYKAFLSGKIPPDTNVPGSPTQQASLTAVAASMDCLVGNPFQASAFGFSVSAGPTCLFTRSNARAFIGAGFILGGGVIFITGGFWIMAGAALSAFGVPSGLPQGPWKPPPNGVGPWTPPSSSGAAGPSMTAEQVPASSASSAAGVPAGKVIQGEVISSSTAAPLAIAA